LTSFSNATVFRAAVFWAEEEDNMLRIQIVTAILAISIAQAGQTQAGTISTLPSWDGSTSVSAFGYPDSATYGQTVTATSQSNVLNSFAFEMSVRSSLSFRGEVFAWDGTKATGSALFESAVKHTTSSAFQLVTFDTGGLHLQSGQQYVLFASISKDYAANLNSDSGSWGTQFTDTYSGGQFVYLNNGGNASAWTSDAWSTIDIGSDAAFTAEFATESVPEPTSIALFGIGGLAAACGAYRRRQQATHAN
jgi:hypothetical protein